jgi:hypothetical protein
MKQQFICGFPDQWKGFQQRNHEFLERLENVQVALNLTFLRTFSSKGPEDRTIFTIGRLCSEEFYEITLLAANGYGFGALRLLRSLYERAVTMAFLSDNPNEVDSFLNYHAVAQHKLMRVMQDSFGIEVLPAEVVEKTERDYAGVKADYQVTDCPKCGTKRVNHTWHKLDVVSMAKKTIFGPLIVPGYYYPMSHVHSTVHALLSRLETVGGGLGFRPDLQPEEADKALITAHNIVLGVIETQKKFFHLDQLETPLQTCLQDFKDIWKESKDASCGAPVGPGI